jgi:riboflavin kinase/FMN adenylyltransferase
MKKIKIFELQNTLNQIESAFGLVIGNFDGVHLGHLKHLENFQDECLKKSLVPVIITFDPHPYLFLNPKKKGFLINSMSVRLKKLGNAGFSKIIVLDFDKSLQQLDSRQFLDDYILDAKRLKLIYLGHDFKIGKGKESSKELLTNLAKNKNTEVKESSAVLFGDTVISSTEIRKTLYEDISRAKLFLGEDFFLEEYVVKGKGLGKKELFPTCNVSVSPGQCIPSFGVYLTKVFYDNREYDSITNVGVNPTVATEISIKIETHIFFFNKDIYDEKISIKFLSKIRDEKKFEKLQDLRKQISLDFIHAKVLHREKSDVKLALIGKNLTHSKSQEVYEELLNRFVNYTLIDCESTQSIPSLEELSQSFKGVSITSPYKNYFVGKVTLQEKSLSVINALVFEASFVGINTDYLACQDILDGYLENEFTGIYLLGDGSMAKVIETILLKKNIPFFSYSRKLGNLASISTTLANSDKKNLIINCCAREFIFKPEDKASYSFWDLNDNQEEHIKLFESSTAEYVDGYSLLEKQAKYALSFWKL